MLVSTLGPVSLRECPFRLQGLDVVVQVHHSGILVNEVCLLLLKGAVLHSRSGSSKIGSPLCSERVFAAFVSCYQCIVNVGTQKALLLRFSVPAATPPAAGNMYPQISDYIHLRKF